MLEIGDKSWTKIPVLHMAGRVLPGGKFDQSSNDEMRRIRLILGVKQLMASCKT